MSEDKDSNNFNYTSQSRESNNSNNRHIISSELSQQYQLNLSRNSKLPSNPLSLSISRDKSVNFKPPNIPQLNRKIVDGLNTTNQKNTASTSTNTASTKRKALFFKAKKLRQTNDNKLLSDNRSVYQNFNLNTYHEDND